MAVIYRNDGPWGAGKNYNLTPGELDGNFWQLVRDITAKAPQGVGIASFSVAGDQLTVVLTDSTLLGPYLLPTAKITFRGEWLPSTAYYTNDIFTHSGTTYIVQQNHTSATTFDPFANDGGGNDYYAVLLQNAAGNLPPNGNTGTMLRKTSTLDYAMAWQPLTLDELADVNATAPIEGAILTYRSGAWTGSGSGGGGIVPDPPISKGEVLVYNGSTFTNTAAVDLPTSITSLSVSGAHTLNRSNGEVQQITLLGDTAITISGWPSGGQFARLLVKVFNASDHYILSWPFGIKWPSGVEPQLTPSGTDIYIFTSWDGGTTIYGNAIGQGYL
jgi:hypothetical protein